jgi:hypothetical protein
MFWSRNWPLPACCLAVASLLGATLPAPADTIAVESFESYVAGSNLSGGGGGSGWTANWSAATGHVTVQTKHLQVGGQDGELQAAGILPTASISNNDSIMSRAFPASTGSVYLSFLLRLESFENDDFVQFQLSDGAVGNVAATLSVGVSNTTNNPFFARIGQSGNTTTSGVSAADNTDYFLVARFSADGAASYNRVDLFLNPTSSVEAEQTPIATRVGPATGLTQLDLFNVRVNSLEVGDSIFVDNIRITDSFASATAVPEPATLLLGGLGAGAVALYARRRKARA